MRIAFVYKTGRPAHFSGRSYDMGDDGGSEGAMVQYAFALAKLGHNVRIYIPGTHAHEHRGVEWRTIEGPERFNEEFDVVIALRFPNALKGMVAPVKAIFCCDPAIPNLPAYVSAGDVQLVIVISEHQKARFQQQHPIDESLYLLSNAGIHYLGYSRRSLSKVRGRCVYCSVPERGLRSLVTIWPLIRKRVPWATLHVTGGMELWGIHLGDPFWVGATDVGITGVEGITYLGYVPRNQLIEEQLQSQVMLLPGSPASPEMCCMAAMECAAARNALVVTDLSALPERVIQGRTGTVVPRKGEWQLAFANAASDLLLNPELYKIQLQAQAEEQVHDYTVLAQQWVTRFGVLLHARQ